MRLTCPNCAASYDVPDHLLAGAVRRPVRCTRCDAVWTPSATETEAPAPAAPAPEPRQAAPGGSAGIPSAAAGGAAVAGEMPSSRPPWRLELSPAAPEEAQTAGGGARLALAAAWLASLALVAGGAAALWAWRDEVGALWPPARRLFSWLGG
ncbi:zinc-ribbon domain-containing protein [Caldovatus aquaticus]|uniref:Zinc-ribbon domain-containing protein n=1 Tax=Caldovatus aquaticus TaxID=2865671 RepID=A0ABS7F3D2_9PROT|nr:zinc-ribbon domain-containing protein [Caldovatus aquaticus]MBW8270122.1 zinc-ribbon domain-containing protein [Caldovatus aquaticus]